MNIGDICKRKVITIGEHDELTRAAELMREKHIGYLVVVKPNIGDGTSTPIGVVTDRDIVVAVIARGADPRSLRVGDVMTRQPVVVEQDKPVSAALKDMRSIGVRRLPVVDHAGALVGVLSVDDVLDALAGELWDVASSIRQEVNMEGIFRQ
jgi:CBS domain-containing protein